MFWKWNVPKICSVKWNSGMIPDLTEPGIYSRFTSRNKAIFWFTEWNLSYNRNGKKIPDHLRMYEVANFN